MKTGMIVAAAAAGLLAMAAPPAKAHHAGLDVSLHFGPAYVRYRDDFYRLDRMQRRWDGYRYRHRWPARRWQHRSWVAAHDLWHRCHDGRWYRYYDRKHWKLHQRRDRGLRHRHWRRDD